MRPPHNVGWAFLVCLLFFFRSNGQSLTELSSGTKAHLRGLCPVNEKVIWASGTGGQVGRSTDGGETWTWKLIPGFEKIDFRDIVAFNDRTALVMGVGSPGYILRTEDKGQNWTIVYKNEDTRIFLDDLLFWNDRSGIALGDPIDGRFFMLRSFDGGRTWQELPEDNRPVAREGEACFASSGSNMSAISQKEFVFVSGGTHSRIFIRDSSLRLPILQGWESAGANSLATYRKKMYSRSKHWIVVGGDFSKYQRDSAVCVLTRDGGKTWMVPTRPPFGYRSSVSWIDGDRAIACGMDGVDVTEDGGMNWRTISREGYHVCKSTRSGKTVFLAGAKGRIARLQW